MSEQTETKQGARWTWKRVLLLLCLVAGVGAFFWRDSASDQAKGRMARMGGAPMPVAVAFVTKAPVRVYLDALGTVTSLSSVTVKTRLNGEVKRIGFEEGQTVKAGDFLVQIDPRPYEQALAEAEGTLARDQALLKDAEGILARFKVLREQDALSQQELETQEALVRQYQGSVKADQAKVEAARLDVGYCRVVAPVAGRVGLRKVDVGNYAQSSDSDGLVSLTQLHPISVLLTLPEDTVSVVQQRMREKNQIEVLAYDRAGKDLLAVGSVSALDNQIDGTTGTIKLRALFDNTEEKLFPNQFVNVRVVIQTLPEALVIPSSAVLKGAKGDYVYAVNDDQTVSVRPVTKGPAEGENVAVDGLTEGMRVVVDGADKLKEGAKVTVPQSKGADEAAQPKAGEGAKHHRATAP